MTDSKPITDDPNWTTGDLEIISADRVRFRAKRRWVAHASEVLGDMMEGGQESIIEFTDERIETATALDIFLHLAPGTCTTRDFGTDGARVFKALPFLHKWDCRVALSALAGLVALGSLISEHPYTAKPKASILFTPSTLFLLGALLPSREILDHASIWLMTIECPHPRFTAGHDIEPKYIHALWAVYHGVKMKEPLDRQLKAFQEALDEGDSAKTTSAAEA